MPTHAPQISVILATHNRRELLRRCLEALARQALDPADFEVIVADDGSTDGTAEMVDSYEALFRLSLLRLDKSGKAGALNAGVEASDATTCLFIDDDVIASPELVGAHLGSAREQPMTIGVGTLLQEPPHTRDWYAHAFAQGWNEHFEALLNREAQWTDCYGGNFSCPRQRLAEIGGFATDLPAVEDSEVAYRLCRSGCLPTYIPEALAVHDDQKLGPRMIADAWRQGVACIELAARFPELSGDVLDWPQGAGPRELFLRRLLIASRVPPGAVAWPGRLIPGLGRKMIWMHVVRKLAFWGGVRRSVSRERWRQLTRGGRPGQGSGGAR
jgi:glycosyltransferase involved in cell wall biosynthesis